MLHSAFLRSGISLVERIASKHALRAAAMWTTLDDMQSVVRAQMCALGLKQV